MKLAFLLILAMLFWGGGWTALKILTQCVPVEIVSFWRFLIMFISFIPILFYLKVPLRLPRKSLSYIMSSSVLNVAFMIFAYMGVERATAGSGGVIITVLSPMFTFLLTLLFFKAHFSKIQYIGFAIGVLGGAIMLNIQDLSSFFNGGEFYFILCALIWAGVTLLAQHSHPHIHPIHYSFYISAVATVIMFLISYDTEQMVVFEQGLNFWIALVYLGVFGQTIATTIYFVASGRLGSSKTSSFMFLVPVFALLISYIILDEPLQLHIVLGGLISLFAVYLINQKRT